MSVLELNTLYEETLAGEPLPRRVEPLPMNTDRPLWTVGDWSLDLPAPPSVELPEIQHLLSDIRAWTGWSQRQLASALCTSHTTVSRAEAGRPLHEARSGDLGRRIRNAHNLIERLFIVAGRDPRTTRQILETTPGGRPSAIDALRTANYERAYIAALDAARPRATGMLVGSRPRRPGATAALHE